MKTAFVFGLILFSTLTHAAMPDYKAPEILVRANLRDGYNLPPMSFISNPSPSINNRGDVALKIMGSNGETTQGLWLKLDEEENGKIVYFAPEERFMTEPQINNQSKIAFNLYDEGVTDGLFTFDGVSLKVDQVLKPEGQDLIYYTYPQIMNDGKIFFRGTNENNERTFFSYLNGNLQTIITEGIETYGQKSSYLFRLHLNEKGEMVFKRRLGESGQWDESNGDEILFLKPNAQNGFDSTVIARDRDADPTSFYLGFSNNVTVSKSGLATFTATLEDSHKTLVLYKEGILRNLAIEKADDLSEIEMFTPKVNDQGLVAFRAKDLQGKRGIFIASTFGIKKLIGEGDEIMTDLGMAKILSNPNFPGFSGEIDMNDNGDIVFTCILVGAADNKEWGTAVFKLSPKK
jgi:hypothetical protein